MYKSALRKSTKNSVLAAIKNFQKNDEKTAAEFIEWHQQQEAANTENTTTGLPLNDTRANL